MRPTFVQCTTVFSVLSTAAAAQIAFTAYANDFVNPDYILAGNFGNNTQAAQATITAWASSLAVGGPWSKAMSPWRVCYRTHAIPILQV